MEKLENVIAGLRFCCEPNCICEDGCPYEGRRDGDRRCLDFLMEDALAVIEDLKTRLDMAKHGRLELGRKLRVVAAERDAARAKLARVIGEREAAWVELGEKPMPNDYGEYVPEFPREGM